MVISMPYTQHEKKKAITRLRRIKGQAESLERAIEEGTECSLLLQQISALRGATNSLMSEILESHLRETFGSDTELSLKEKNHALDDVLNLVRVYLK